MEHFGSMA